MFKGGAVALAMAFNFQIRVKVGDFFISSLGAYSPHGLVCLSCIYMEHYSLITMLTGFGIHLIHGHYAIPAFR